MMSLDGMPLAFPVGLAILIAALLSFLIARSVAQNSRLLDVPGPRSSHVKPTARGGGIGIVIVGLATIAGLAFVGLWPFPWLPISSAFALVAAIGALDDIRHRPVLLRLGVHTAAATMLVVSLALQWYGAWLAGPTALLAVVALMWSTNLHNFMDGIDGLLSQHAIWAGLVYAGLFWLAAQPSTALFALLLAAASAGFLPMNWPRARVFLGDGASGYIGLAVGWLALYGIMRGVISLPENLIVLSAFLVDSGATLMLRAVRGERFWQAHREHLYQRLVRRGHTHAAVSSGYMLWNLVVALPALMLARHADDEATRWIITATVLTAAAFVWAIVRRDRALRAPTGAA